MELFAIGLVVGVFVALVITGVIRIEESVPKHW